MTVSNTDQKNIENGNDAPNENDSRLNTQSEDEFKEGGYGWVVIFGVFILNAHTWGLNSSYSVFLAYYLRTGTFGTSQLGYAFVGGLSISIALLASPLATSLVGWKRCGTRRTIFLGVIFETIGFIGSSFASKLWHLILSQGVSFGLGMGLCFVASASVPPQWFVKRRSFANSIAASGSGFGGLCYSLATNAMITNIGLPWAFRILAIICFVVNSVAAYLIRDRNAAIGSVHVAFNWSLFRRPSFLLLQAWMVLSLIAYVILVFSIVDYCQSVGLTASRASLVGAIFNLFQGLGRPMIGLSSDSVGRLNIANLSTLFCGLLCLFFWTFGTKTFASCIVFAILSGSVAGVMWATVAPITAEVVGLALIPSALSMTWVVLVLPATFAEVIAVSLRRPGEGGYIRVQLFTAFLYIGAFLFGWTLRAWKVWELEQVRLEKEERELAIRDEGVLSSALEIQSHNGDPRTQSSRRPFSIIKGLWVIERV
ncbi:MFS general substrate transporter [Annulohypoxylon maeteangense]|uniref:MFS general substrate transporter n=1 Tax=Annulohypoxylon maeteangense TaxID=1927788 RepID=UPI002007DE4E|nr:MFS general substrate transporter [Annulohypoxylon maeteangense]KAI0880354.1 MFS general substrate transporter [Annulohypoxylon maeteangense]